MKICRICKVEKEDNEFRIRNVSTGLRRNECISCKKEISKTPEKRKKSNENRRKRRRDVPGKKEKDDEVAKRSRLKNIEKIRERDRKEYADRSEEQIKKDKERKRKFKEDNREELRVRENERRKDPGVKLQMNAANSIRRMIGAQGERTSAKFEYSNEDFKKHIEDQFEDWMTWDNYGKYKADEWQDNDKSTWKWQVDHIVPHSTFGYKSMDDDAFKECWNLSNLRPYSAKQNIIDGSRRTRHKKGD